MNAIVHQGDQTFIVLVSNEQDGVANTSRKEVRLLPRDKNQSSSSVREIEAVGGQDIVGQKYVTAGAHFLVEGQQVRIVDSQAAAIRSATESSE